MIYKVPSTRFLCKVGIELEGGWAASRRTIRPYADGSVNHSLRDAGRSFRDGCEDCSLGQDENDDPSYSCGVHNFRVGEICSRPLDLGESIAWLLQSYPDVHDVTCGMHVHVSLKSTLRYSQLMDTRFWTYYRARFERWAKRNLHASSGFWPRWRGENQYCLADFSPDEQSLMRHKGGARYATLNYAYHVEGDNGGPRKTLECRVFPMFKEPTVAAAAICEYVRTVESYLSTIAGERAEPVEIPLDVFTDEHEEIIECV